MKSRGFFVGRKHKAGC